MLTADSSKTCGECGAPLAPDEIGAFCPACLSRTSLLDELDPSANEDELSRILPAASFGTRAHLGIGDYELLEEIGRGGMGVVWKARQRSLDRIVALKMLLFSGLASAENLERFRREAHAAAALAHPNIVRVLEITEHDRQPLLVMDYIEGESLAQRLQRDPLPAREAAQLIEKIARAMHLAHERGIIHRDLKPSNILLDHRREPHVTDFGLAKLTAAGTSDLTLSAQALGTPSYMPPEQAVGQTTSATADIYGLGAILYHCLTGRPPFQSATIPDLLVQLREQEPVAPRLLNSRIPRDLETICLKCLEKDPVKRYPTAGALADDLQRFLNNEPITARPITRTAKLLRWSQRNPALATAYSLLILLLILILISSPLAIYRINQARNAAEHSARQELSLRRLSEVQNYTSDIALADRLWQEGNLGRAQELLRAQIPKPGAADPRGFEWRYLWKASRTESLRQVTLSGAENILGLATPPTHSFVVAACDKSIRILDPATAVELRRFPLPNSDLSNPYYAISLASAATNILAAHRAGGLVTLWDLSTGNELARFRAFNSNLQALALSSDGSLLATISKGDWEGDLAVWDVSRLSRGVPSAIWSHHINKKLTRVEFTPDGRALLVAQAGSPTANCSVWEVRTGDELAPFPAISAGSLYALAISADGSLVACSGVGGEISVLRFATRTREYTLEGHAADVNSVAFSSDGKRLLSAADDYSVRLWDIEKRAPSATFSSPDTGMHLAVFTPGEKQILASAGTTIRLFACDSQSTSPPVMETEPAWSWPAISRDSKWLVVTPAPQTNAHLQVWDLSSQRKAFELVFGVKPLPAVFSPDGSLFASGDVDRGNIALWETKGWVQGLSSQPPAKILNTDFEVGSLAFTPDGKILAAAGLCFYPHHPSGATNRLAFWEVGSWRKLDLLPGAGSDPNERSAAATVAFSPDGQLLAIGYRDGRVRLWDFRQQLFLRDLKRVQNNWMGAKSIFSRDGHWLATYPFSAFGAELYDISDPKNPRLVTTLKTATRSILFDRENKTLVTSSNDGLINFWNLQTRNLVLSLRHGHGAFLEFAPSGDLLVSEDGHGTIKLWSAASISSDKSHENNKTE
jgi:serine/threonine protein kinase